MTRPTHNAWGRRLDEADGSSIAVDMEALFREVGLCEADARIAARGLADGSYLSFADAVQSRLMWDSGRRNRVDSDKVAEVSRGLPRPSRVRREPDGDQGLARAADRVRRQPARLVRENCRSASSTRDKVARGTSRRARCRRLPSRRCSRRASTATWTTRRRLRCTTGLSEAW